MLTGRDAAAHEARAVRALVLLDATRIASAAREVYALQQRVRAHESAQEATLARVARDAQRRAYDTRQ